MTNVAPSQPPNGNGRWPSVRISLASFGAISSALTLVSLIVGFIAGAMTFKQSVADLRAGNVEVQDRLNALSMAVANERERATNRLTTIEAELKYVVQGIAELKLVIVPKR